MKIWNSDHESLSYNRLGQSDEQPTQLTPSEEQPTQLTPPEEQPTQLTPSKEQLTRPEVIVVQ